MKFGFLQTAACTPDLKVADCRYNADQILKEMKAVAEEGTLLAVFPELCLTGYTCGDLFLQDVLLQGCERELTRILKQSETLEPVFILGLPLRHGQKLYNVAAVISRGKLLGLVPKKNIPNYAEFNELRYFTPAPAETQLIQYCGQEVPFGTGLLFCCDEMPLLRLAVEICEDLGVPVPPSAQAAAAGATVIVNLSASDEIVGKDDHRRRLVTGQSGKLCCAYLYADAGSGESTTDLVFSGHNLIAQNGRLLVESVPFSGERCTAVIDLEECVNERRRMNTFPADCEGVYNLIQFSLPLRQTQLRQPIRRNPFIPEDGRILAERCEKILAIQSAGLRKRITHVNAASVVIGVSGGLDSTLALLVCVRAMRELKRPLSDIVAVTMPSFGTTRRTRNNAVNLCRALGVTLREINITRTVKSHFKDLDHDPEQHDVLFENAQARERTQVLMDISHQVKGFVVGTGDLSELALGWATYNGDHMSMYGVNASIPKTLVRYLVSFFAETDSNPKIRKTLKDILATPVSPELLPAKEGQITQLTESLIGPYELHDFFLYYLVRRNFSPQKIKRMAMSAFEGAYQEADIDHWLTVFLKRFFNNQFKRSCMPDGPKVGTVSFSPRGDWRMPSDAMVSEWLASLEMKS